VNALGALKTYSRTWQPVAPAGSRCQVCALALDAHPHAHVVDLERRSLLCACETCAALAEPARAGADRGVARYRLVPTRVLIDPAFVLDRAQWDELRIPVQLAFIFFNTREDRWVAFYPSPAGAAESALSLDGFRALAARAPLVAAIEPDVEALLVRGQAGGVFEAFLVSIETCYRLVGQVRLYWQGIHGGDRAWREIDSFFAGLRAQARPLAPEAGA
jgi:Family of unknown function (DUF5947)